MLPQRSFSTSWFAFAALSTAALGCGPVMPGEAGELAPADDSVAGEVVGELSSASVDGTLDGCGAQCVPQGCVVYARCRTANDAVAGTLPGGLVTWSNKTAIINASAGHRGCVAMIPTSSVYGHVAYVEDTWTGTDGLRHYRLSEASWAYNSSCDNRSGTKAGLNIRGFWCG
ncbi:MAG: hypothetical protein K1X89_28260 [Myxococcaceae bacterium]|nr:hypothetical protein [Myxococcaceae bacterium]